MYSWGHKTLDAATDNEYWNWTWADMGMYDDRANISAMKEATGQDKIFYIGYSQGTIQMFNGLIKKGKDISDSLHSYVALAPCTVAGDSGASEEDLAGTLFKLDGMGIYA